MNGIILSTQPFFSLLLGVAFLGEKLTLSKFVVFLIAFFGLVLVLNPFDPSDGAPIIGEDSGNFWWGIIFAFCTSFQISVSAIILKKSGLISQKF